MEWAFSKDLTNSKPGAGTPSNSLNQRVVKAWDYSHNEKQQNLLLPHPRI